MEAGLTLEAQLDAATGGVAFSADHAPGLLSVTGRDGLDLLHRISTNRLEDLSPGMSRETIFTDAKGRLVDVATVGVLEDRIVLICSSGFEKKLMDWVEKFIITEDVAIKTLTAEFTIIKLIGPRAISTTSALFEAEVSPESVVEIKGGLGLIVAIASSSKRGDQVVLLTDGREGGGSVKEVGERVAKLGALSLGKEAWDLYRIARGIPGAGTEISGRHNPYDVALIDLVSYTKGCYVGQEVIARLDTYQKVRKTLFGVRCSERPAGLELPVSLQKNAVQVGVCTSLSGSPFLGEHLGLAVLQQDAIIEGDVLSMVGLNQDVSCVVSSIPMEFASG